MGKGNYDHPNYLVRQQIHLGATTAGANGTSCRASFTSAMRIRNVSAAVQTAGTSATTGHKAIVLNGTTSVGEVVLGNGVANTVGTSGDLNSALAAGDVLSIKNGTDATGVAKITAELHIDPAGSWT